MMVGLAGGCPTEPASRAAAHAPAPPATSVTRLPDAARAPTLDASDRASSLDLPAAIGLPAPYDRLLPFQKAADVRATLGTLATPAGDRAPKVIATMFGDIYASPIPGLFVVFGFQVDDRLRTVELTTTSRELFDQQVRGRWGLGTSTPTERFRPEVRKYPPSSAGWSVELVLSASEGFSPLDVGQPPAQQATLRFTAIDIARTNAAVEAAFPSPFLRLKGIVGSPIARAVRELGADLRIEGADEVAPVAEAPGKQQGYMRWVTPWSARPWEITLAIGPEGSVTSATILALVEESQRTPLFAALKAAFGAPKVVVAEDGSLALEFAAGRFEVSASDRQSAWWIEISSRAASR